MLAARAPRARAGRASTRSRPVADAEELRAARASVDATAVAPEVLDYVVAVVRRTRELPSVALGASPRAAVHLLGAAKAVGPAGRARLRHARRRRPHGAARCCATGSCSRPRPSWSATRRRARCAARSTRCPSRGEPDAAAPPRCSRRSRVARPRSSASSPRSAAVALARRACSVDARAVRRAPAVARDAPGTLSRGVPAALHVAARAPGGGAVRIRQAAPPDLELAPREGDGAARRDARRPPPRPARAARARARAASGRCGSRAGTTGRARPAEVSVYPDLVAARRLALSVRRGQFREQGVSARGPLGLGTDFELVRDYLPDDDVRQVNWRATARLGRPMSNQYRVEQDRDVVLLVDAGRLAAAALPADGGRGAPARAPSSTRRSTPWPPSRSSPTRSATAAARSPSTARSGSRCRRGARAARSSCARCTTSSRGSSTPTTRRRSAAWRAPSARSC